MAVQLIGQLSAGRMIQSEEKQPIVGWVLYAHTSGNIWILWQWVSQLISSFAHDLPMFVAYSCFILPTVHLVDSTTHPASTWPALLSIDCWVFSMAWGPGQNPPEPPWGFVAFWHGILSQWNDGFLRGLHVVNHKCTGFPVNSPRPLWKSVVLSTHLPPPAQEINGAQRRGLHDDPKSASFIPSNVANPRMSHIPLTQPYYLKGN